MPDLKRPAESFARLYDDVLDNPKVAKVKPDHFGLYCAMISYSHRNDTDGLVPFARARGLLDFNVVGYVRAVKHLQNVGLIEEQETGWVVHDYPLHNETHAQRNAKRIAASNAARIRWASNEQSDPQSGMQSGTDAKEKEKEKEKTVISNEITSNGAHELCRHLEVSLHLWGAKGHTTKAWITAADRLLRIDGRPFAEAIEVLDWAISNEFWRPNILSLPTFREKYDTLRGQMQRKPSNGAADRLQLSIEADLAKAVDLRRQGL